jgi:two-component system NtrC family sensor kinase
MRTEEATRRAVDDAVPGGLILIAHEDVVAMAPVRARLSAAGYDVVFVTDGSSALEELHRVELDVALVALGLPGRGGLDVLSAARHLSPETEVVILTERAELGTALECIRRGAFDLLTTPIDLEDIVLTIARALERRALRATTTLFLASQEILRNQDASKLPDTIVSLVARVLETDDVTLALAGPDGQMHTRHSCSINAEMRAIAKREVGDEVGNLVAALGDAVLLPDDAAVRLPALRLERIRSAIVFPLACGDRRVGVLTLSRIADHRPYRRMDVERTAVLASQALLAVENAALLHRMVEAERLVTVGNLAAGVAHEINNPLTYVTASACEAFDRLARLRQSANARPSAEVDRLLPALLEVEEALSDVCDGAQRIADIARDLRALARVQNPVHQDVDLSAVVRSAQRITQSKLRCRAIVTTDLASDAIIGGDEGRLVQVFVNLIVNALQASDGRRTVAIHLATERAGDRIVATVRDDGPGMTPELRAQVFQPFFSTKSAANGTGLGLSISQSIVAEHHGIVSVESAPGQGATFVLSFPVLRAGVGGPPTGRPRAA